MKVFNKQILYVVFFRLLCVCCFSNASLLLHPNKFYSTVGTGSKDAYKRLRRGYEQGRKHLETIVSRGQAVVCICRNLKPGPHLRTLPDDTERADVDGVAVTFLLLPFEIQRCRFFVEH